ncbi:Cupin-like domain 8 [Dillenia turbinata]|uniref:Cupin-like domain 8 n=1 Tax=Dillenia turbinata TaxID=194707 RepID=A0AAN8W0C1_9MAGN
MSFSILGEVGSSVVGVMLSRSAPVFYGDPRSHERIPLPFSSFVELCKRHLQGAVGTVGGCLESYDHGSPQSDIERCFSGEISRQIYLAQVPIMNAENEESIQLGRLREDIQLICVFLLVHSSCMFFELSAKGYAKSILEADDAKKVPNFVLELHFAILSCSLKHLITNSSLSDEMIGLSASKNINSLISHFSNSAILNTMAANTRKSTTHLFQLVGVDEIPFLALVLWLPSASPLLYPKPIYGKSSNHSSVPLEVPDFSIHPRASHLGEISQKVVLHAGDALFIPEGCCSCFLKFLERQNQGLHQSSASVKNENRNTETANGERSEDKSHDLELKFVNKNFENTKQNQMTMLNQLKPQALQGLHELISVVHEHVTGSDQNKSVQTTTTNHPIFNEDYKNAAVADLYHLQDDPVAGIIWGFEPLILRDVFLAMVHNFPRTLEALIVHSLSPVGAEVLTRKFDEMDRQLTEDDRNEFYQQFYGVFDDQFAAMDTILNGKESFACQGWLNLYHVASLEVRQNDSCFLGLVVFLGTQKCFGSISGNKLRWVQIDGWMRHADADYS